MKTFKEFIKESSLNDAKSLFMEMVNEIKVKNKDKFKNLKYKNAKIIDLKDVLKLDGLNDENRTFHFDEGVGKMFGNYTLSEWYCFLQDIAENGLKHPIFLYDGKISEGNHRVKALEMLGFTKIPVENEY